MTPCDKLTGLPRGRRPTPTTALMTAYEVLAWIAYGEVQKLPFCSDMSAIADWNTTKLDDLLIALKARAADEPYTPLERAFRSPLFASDYAGQENAKKMHTLRAQFRLDEKRMVSFSELRDRLAQDNNRIARHNELIALASEELRSNLAANLLTASGRPIKRVKGNWPHRDPKDSWPREDRRHKAIPPTTFMDRNQRITGWNTLESESLGRQYIDLQFRTAEVLRVWGAGSGYDKVDVDCRSARIPSTPDSSSTNRVRRTAGATPEAPVREPPSRQRKINRQARLTAALVGMSEEGWDLRNGEPDELKQEAMRRAGIKALGGSPSTFHRAFRAAREQIAGII
jgi:hypothetical protein